MIATLEGFRPTAQAADLQGWIADGEPSLTLTSNDQGETMGTPEVITVIISTEILLRTFVKLLTAWVQTRQTTITLRTGKTHIRVTGTTDSERLLKAVRAAAEPTITEKQ